MNTASLGISESYMSSLFALSDEEKISLATQLLNSIKFATPNAADEQMVRPKHSFLNFKGILKSDVNEKELLNEYISEKYGI